MKILPLIPTLLLFFSCKEENKQTECVPKNYKNENQQLLDEDPNFRNEFKAQETYVVETTDSWNYAATVVFEKYNDLDYKLKTVYSERDFFKTEKKMSKDDWMIVKSTLDSFNFWCFKPEWSKGVSDGFEVRFKGIKDSNSHYIRVFQYEEEDSILRDTQIFLRKTAFNLLNMGGLEIPKKPKIFYHRLDKKKIGIKVYSPNRNFSKVFEVYLDDKKIETKQGVAEIIILESDLDKFKLKVKEVLINDVELSFEATLSQYLLDVNKNNK
jgi:hypothetical protein